MADPEDLFSVFDEQPKKKRRSEPEIKQEKNQKIVDNFLKEIADGKRNCEEEPESEYKKQKVANILDDINPEEFSSRIQIHTVETVEACLHEVAVPHDSEYVALRQSTSPPSRKYPFILDPFQKEAILCLENNQSVLVSAHTSAGKTVVAEYAISMSLRDKQRVIYTTPIKALSNQKYREFYEEFKDVGLLTGDVTINPSASCLIMTTEILRSMLYRGSEVMREVGWVVFDEIHYMRDKERGVVWEETIILLPDSVHYVFLSATIPNARQFAEWICHLHHQPCHVVYTDYRPVPLQHYIFPAGGDGLHLVVDENGNFREENFNTAMNVLQVAGGAAKGDSAMRGRKGGMKDGSNCYKLVKMIMERNFAPVIVFSFSKKECEAYALQMAKLDFNSAEEKPLVEEVFRNAMDVLSDEDKKLPQVEHVLPLLKRGIGIHHGGLLPILKETIEILFAEGLIKALFATETFAMGLNMPARTVLFTNARKFDGRDFRWVTSGEYIQMSGRAGRRGLDERGIVILMVDEKMSPSAGKDIVKGLPDPINSAFHLTYNMVLNLLRVDEINPEYMLERSFFQFQNYSIIPQLCDKIKSLQEEHDSIDIEREEEVELYYKIQKQLAALSEENRSYIVQPEHCVPFFQPGRLVKVKNGDDDFGWGIIINYQKKTLSIEHKKDPEVFYVVDVLLEVSRESADTKITSSLKPPPSGEKGIMQVVPIKLNLIQQLSSVRAYYPEDLRPLDNRMKVLKTIQSIKDRFPDGLPILDPISDMKIKDPGVKEVAKKIEAFTSRLNHHPLHNNPAAENLLGLYKKKLQIEEQIKEKKAELKKARSLLQMDELKCRKRVLRRMGYCTASDVIEIKGRVACEVSSADELLLTEMVFNGAFNNLNIHQTTALLSCFVFQEKSNEMPKLTEELSGPLRLMQDTARRIAKISKESKLDVDTDQYVDMFKPHLMDVVHAWSKGASFAQVCKMTDVFEGSVIRCMRRLEELMRQMCQAAKAIGNTEMENKFSEGIKLIKRDIVFAASLYL
ncbi:exosome RNA helicase MTR4-like [Uloborus diversus]|uniref:exosome RNA helicase MTR4-like n=1 Tax=Uloborus diversus TaxID=327109 RepID=UPI00240A1B77|nr:exosome RNA helicase MTR4-like [Uloborus diversus]